MAEGRRLTRQVVERARRLRRSEDERRLAGSVLFDEHWYGLQVGRRFGRRAAVRHYLEIGVGEGHQPHPLVDPAYLRSQWGPDRLRRLGAGDPLSLYLRRQAFRAGTHLLFDTAGYVARVPEAATHPSGPTAHYLEVGAGAGLAPNDWLDGDLRAWVAERRTTAAAVLAAPPPLPALSRAPAADDGSLVSVVVVTAGDGVGATAAVESAMAGAPAVRAVECLVWDNGSRAEVGAVLDALPVRFPSVRVVHAGRDLGLSRARNLALGHVRGSVVVFLHDDVVLRPGWLDPLVAPLDDPEVLGVQPVLIGKDLLVRSAGYAYSDRGLPHHFLRGFPADDTRRVGGLRLGALSGAALAVRRADLLALGGFEETFGDEVAAIDLCERLAGERSGGFSVAADVVGVHHDRHVVDEAAQADRERYHRLRRERSSTFGGEHELWAAVGFRVVDDDVRSVAPEEAQVPPMLRVPQPLLVREARFHSHPRPLRWAIKNPSPARSTVWGDIHYSDGLAEALRSLGQEVVIDRYETFERPTVRHDDVALLIRGPVPARPAPEHPTLAWVISHPDSVTADELRGYDAVFAASAGWAQRRSQEWQIEIQTLLQATDPARFGPGTASPDTGADVLFVGNSHDEFRPIVRDALTAGLDVTIYGTAWEKFVGPDRVAGRYLDNTLLSAAYRSAGIVLNDHFEDMRREGFISNRIFDAVASGARVISDAVAGLDDVFGGAVPTYQTPADLRRLVVDRKTVFGPDDARARLAESVRVDHSFRARAEVLLAAAHRVVGSR